MSSYFRERAESKALQEALERFDTLVAGGADPAVAARQIRAALPTELRTIFALATALPQAQAAPLDEPAFADAFEARLRAAELPAALPVALRRQPRPAAVLAAAAAIIVLAGLLIPALHSLPGDPLYALKGASEEARIFFASGSAEARLRISLANERFVEVEKLVARSRLRVSGIGVVAAAADENINGDLAALIQATLADAEQQLARATEIITAAPHSDDAASLERLVAVSQHGQDLAENVADVVPHADKPPVLKTVVKLAAIEAQANAARMTVQAAPAQTPCGTATPAPTANPDGATLAPTESPEATPAATPEQTPEGTPTPSPCVTPTPQPSATPGGEETTTPEPSADVTPSATDAPDAGASGTTGSGDGSAQSSGATDSTAGQTAG